ncbi:MAG: YoaK family protein [Roseiflexaceae bacterium]
MQTSTQQDPLPAVLIALTVTTGLVDAVSFLGLGHVFTANMTGNVVFLGFALAGFTELSAGGSLASLAAFLVGALLGGWLGTAMGGVSKGRWLLVAAYLEAAFHTAAAAFVLLFGQTGAMVYGVIILSALAMGLRNATVRRLAVPDLTTTVLTLTATGLAADSSLAGGSNPRLGRRVASILAMGIGAVLGALLLRWGGLVPPLLLSAVVVLITGILYARHPTAQTAA